MSFTIVDIREINKYFGSKKVARELTEEGARISICDYTESVLNKTGKDKDKAQTKSEILRGAREVAKAIKSEAKDKAALIIKDAKEKAALIKSKGKTAGK